jgi:hypothetical protein
MMTVQRDEKKNRTVSNLARGAMVATAVATMFASVHCTPKEEQTEPTPSEKATEKASTEPVAKADASTSSEKVMPKEAAPTEVVAIKCYGANDCKGQGACAAKDGSHACAGKNECKGKGWSKMDVTVCKNKGGFTDNELNTLVKCHGENSCKGQGECAAKDGSHACAGYNDCKGQGWTKMNVGDCLEKGGTPERI